MTDNLKDYIIDNDLSPEEAEELMTRQALEDGDDWEEALLLEPLDDAYEFDFDEPDETEDEGQRKRFWSGRG